MSFSKFKSQTKSMTSYVILGCQTICHTYFQVKRDKCLAKGIIMAGNRYYYLNGNLWIP